MPAPTKIAELLGVLARHQVDFIVVGGVAAVIQGAPVNTFDLDVVHARTPDNIERLLGALRELDAVYRIDLKRRLSPTASHLGLHWAPAAGDQHGHAIPAARKEGEDRLLMH